MEIYNLRLRYAAAQVITQKYAGVDNFDQKGYLTVIVKFNSFQVSHSIITGDNQCNWYVVIWKSVDSRWD